MLVISGPKIYTIDNILERTALVVKDSKITAFTTENISRDVEVLTFPANYHLVPGFIDVHIHGSAGCDVMDGTFDALATISKTLAYEGTTSYLATTMTAAPEKITSVLQNVRDYQEKQYAVAGAQLLGVHLEGPFLSPHKVGAQNAANILPPNIKYIKQWQKVSANAIKLVTLAPELPDSEVFIRFLQTQKIVASIGHTDATYTETQAAITAGCSHITHLFNAMRGIHQREPGPITAALLSEQVTAELILDGIHLHPAIVQLAIKNKGKEKIILVTDAMRAKCMADGCYDLGGQTVTVKDAVARLADGTLAGSTLKMSSAIQNMLQFTDCDLMDAIRFAAENPAKMLNIFHAKGSIESGKDADLVVLDEQFNVVATIIAGSIIPRF